MKEQTAPGAQPTDVDALYRAHARPLYAFVYSKVGNRETAEDITSDVFMKALSHLDLAREEHSVVAWLYRVARNGIADYWRAGRGAAVIPFEEAYQAWQSAPLSPHAGQQRATARRARAVLASLPANYRAVLTYRLLEGASVAETAQLMGLSTANVKVLQHRALKRAAGLHVELTPGNAWPATEEASA